MEFKEIKLRDGFVKYEINDFNPETKFHATIHRISSPDSIGPHSHPFSFISTVLRGSYRERVYFKDSYGDFAKGRPYYSDCIRKKGDVFLVSHNTIHEITEVYGKECITIIVPEPYNKEQEWGFYRFDNGIWFRKHNESEFKLIK